MMCSECFSYQPQGARWVVLSGETGVFCSSACAETHYDLPARRAALAASPIQPGATVTRKAATCRTQQRGRGIVEQTYARRHRTATGTTFRLYARVRWLSVYQRFSGGGQDMHSDLLLSALVLADAAPGAGAGIKRA